MPAPQLMKLINVIPDLEELRVQEGIESPTDVANRVVHTLKCIRRFSQLYHQHCPEALLVVWAFTHGDVLRCFLQYAMDVETLAGYRYAFNEAVPINVDSSIGIAQYHQAGKVHVIKL